MSQLISKDQNISTLNYIKDLFENVLSIQELETRLSLIDRLPRGMRIWVQIAYLSVKLNEVFDGRRSNNYEVRLLSDGGAILHKVKTIGRKYVIKLDNFIVFIPTSYKNIYRIVCISDSEFWHKGGTRFIERRYPNLVKIYYKQKELRHILLQYEKALEERFEISVTDITSKEKRVISRKKHKRTDEYDSERRWTDSSIKRAFDDADIRSQWFKSVQLNLRRVGRQNTVAILRISKHGLVAFDHLYDIHLKYLFPSFEKVAYTKTELFSRRGLREREYIPARPVSICYSMDIFHEIKNVRKLAKVIKSYPNSSKSIYHGNPYLHISIADFLDGSSFEIWVLSPRRILIIPQSKASVPSFEKLISYLLENFIEGEVEEYTNG
jgi:hypothetical protein